MVLAAAAVLATAISLAMILGLAREVRHDLDAMARANSESAQWHAAQTDVSFQSVLIAAWAAAEPDGRNPPLRSAFGAVSRRLDHLDRSPAHAQTRKHPEFRAHLDLALAWRDRLAPQIAAEDAALRAALPGLISDTESLRPIIRRMSELGHHMMVQSGDAYRTAARDRLIQVAALTVILIAALVGMVTILASLARESRRWAEEQSLTRNRLQTIVETSRDAILVVDGAGVITEMNSAAEQMFGHSRATATGLRLYRLLDWPGAGQDKPLPGTGTHAVTGLTRDGRRFPAECAAGATDEPLSAMHVLVLRDITARRVAEAALVEARDRALAGEKAKADMLAVMSHEMRTPLNGILGTLDLMDDARLTGQQRDWLRIIRSSADLLLDHVNDVLDIARLDADKMPVARLPFDLILLVQDLVDGLGPAAAQRGNRVLLGQEGALPPRVIGDPQKLRQVLLNLLGNAVKFTRDGVISVTLRPAPDGHLSFVVQDNGIGIPADALGRIFEEFVTVDTSYARDSHGSGLGLPIVRRLVEAMQGRIAVTSTEGQGSTFTVTLPLETAPDPDLVLPRQAEPPPTLPSLSILVVEDNAINRIVLREMLERDGHEVDEAATAAMGITKAAMGQYDLILMDIGLPGMDGLAATRAIRSSDGKGRDVPIIAVTAHTQPDDLQRFAEAGMQRALIKPLSRAALRAIIAEVIPAQAQPLDPLQVDSLRDGLGKDAWRALLDRYVAETASGLDDLRRSANSRALAPLAEMAHRLAGSAAVFGAHELHRHLAAIEDAARAGRVVECLPMVETLDPLWRATLGALERAQAQDPR